MKPQLESLLQGITIGLMGRATNFNALPLFPYAMQVCREGFAKNGSQFEEDVSKAHY